jgi:DNA-binding MarR family transcriptional regulator
MTDACVTPQTNALALAREPVAWSLPSPQGCTNLKLRQLTRAVGAHFDAVVGQCGLRGTQYSLLSHVVKLGPLRPVELARTMKVSPSTLSRNLQPLLDAGWLITCPGNDGRGHLVVATPAGCAKRSEAQVRWREAQEAINVCLGPHNVVALHTLLDTCLDLLAAPAQSPLNPTGD